MRELWTMTQYDLRQRIRDKSVITFGIVVPLALMFVLDLVLGDLTNPELQPTAVAASVPAGDPLGAALVDVVRSLDGVEGGFQQGDTDEPFDESAMGAAMAACSEHGAVITPGRFEVAFVLESRGFELAEARK